MKKLLTYLIIIVTLSSCGTKQYVVKNTTTKMDISKEIVVIKNNFSQVIPAAVYPKYQYIDDYVTKSTPAVYSIDSLICVELSKRNIECRIIDEYSLLGISSNYIKYQDYWAWDFKKYMHVLKITIYDPDNNEIISVASEGNTAGMHDFPNPEKASTSAY